MSIHFDRQQTLKTFENDEENTKTMLLHFKKDIASYTSQLDQALKNHDLQTTRHLIHKLHGSCKYISVPQLATKLNVLDDDAADITADDVLWVIDELKRIETFIYD